MVRKLSAVSAVVAVILGVFVTSGPGLADDDHGPALIVAPWAPPPVVYERAPAPPAGPYVWVPGHWSYGPYGWAWIPGRWEFAPYAGAVWIPGRWVYRPYGWVWANGTDRATPSLRSHRPRRGSRSSWRLRSSVPCGSEGPGDGAPRAGRGSRGFGDAHRGEGPPGCRGTGRGGPVDGRGWPATGDDPAPPLARGGRLPQRRTR